MTAFKPYKGICIQCDKEKWIQNSKGICPECVFKNNHNGKSKQQVYRERQKGKQKKREATGERAMNIEIWMERVHICHNCKGSLGNVPKIHMFMHIKSKGSRGDLRLCKENVVLSCLKCHYAFDFQGIDAYNKRKNINIGKFVGND